MLQSGVLCGFRQHASLRQFLFRRKMLPEKRDAKCTVGAIECFVNAFRIVHIRLNYFSAKRGKSLRLVGVGIARDCAYCEFACRIVENCVRESAALCPCRTQNRDDFLFSHGVILYLCELRSRDHIVTEENGKKFPPAAARPVPKLSIRVARECVLCGAGRLPCGR